MENKGTVIFFEKYKTYIERKYNHSVQIWTNNEPYTRSHIDENIKYRFNNKNKKVILTRTIGERKGDKAEVKDCLFP